ncbi:MAG: Rrf2 family transcriptional regulator, partial [Clostridia bacterium]|nr:Rrf2 family transcriptional regulator [Clostridia bacterium]
DDRDFAWFYRDLAENTDGGFIPLKDVAARQNISLKYLESIMLALSNAGLVDGRHGKGGGYKLNREVSSYTALEILQVTEGDLAPVSCLDGCGVNCERAEECKTLSLWLGFYNLTHEYFGGVTLADLI